jgi:DNA-binding transcriptional LysR family regulator
VDLTQLRYFLEVRARGSLTAAAKQLRVSQPTLTVAMKRLERELGTTLLLRSKAGVTLTTTGRALASDAEELFAIVARAEARIAGLEDREIGRFVVGCHEPLGAYFLPAFLRRLDAQHPGLEPTLFNGPSAVVRDAVLSRDVDFGLVVNPVPHPDLVILKLFHDAVDLFAAPEPGARTKGFAVGTRDEALLRITRGPLVHAGRVSESRELLRALGRQGVVPTRYLSCGDFELVKALAMAGVGVGILPRRVAAYGHHGKLLRLHRDMPHFADRICLVYRADQHKTKAALAMKAALVARGRELDAEGRTSAARR